MFVNLQVIGANYRESISYLHVQRLEPLGPQSDNYNHTRVWFDDGSAIDVIGNGDNLANAFAASQSQAVVTFAG